MSIERLLLGLLTSGISTLGFCLLMKLSPRRLPAAVLGGMLTNLIYDLVFFSFGNLLLSAFLSSLFMALYSDLGARVLRIPATLLIVPCIIPIVPGSYLYYTLYHLFYHRTDLFLHYGKGALQIGLGMAVGMSVAAVLLNAIVYVFQKIRKTLSES